MTSTSVTVLVPATGQRAMVEPLVEEIGRFLQTTGFTYNVTVVDELTRQAVTNAEGDVIVVVDSTMPSPVGAVGDAVALIQSGATDVVFGSRRDRRESWLLRRILVNELPDPALQLQAFTTEAARLLFAEAKTSGPLQNLEIAYLANKYGFRVERLIVQAPLRRAGYDVLSALRAAIAIRLSDRRNEYRSPRRCPVCFSSEVWSSGQISRSVIRVCARCKCRYLHQFEMRDEEKPVRRELRPQPAPPEPIDSADETAHARTARLKTTERRLKVLRNQLPARGRLLEVGVRDGSFGSMAAREYEYVGIDQSAAAARAARGRGLEVYCAALSGFVNTGPAFDAITLHHVFENMTDPHDALARIKELLKPGGLLLVSAIDTESLLFLLSEQKRAAQNFRTRVILYSRSALIELLERSGFEIVSVGPDFAYRDHKFLRYRIASRWPAIAAIADPFLKLLPDPLLVSSGSIRIIAKRRAGAPFNVRAIRSVEPTHAR